MPRRLEYKPLLYTTTMRNPERLKYMLFVLNMFNGQVLTDELATKIVGETIRYGLYRPMKTNNSIKEKWSTTQKGTFSEYLLTDDEVDFMIKHNPQDHKEAGFNKGFPSRFATIFDLMKELGLAYYNPNEKIFISKLGEHLMKSIDVTVNDNVIYHEVVNAEYEQQVFLQAMAKSQRKNPFVRVLNDNIPLILLLQTIILLNGDSNQNGAGISRRELPLLIFWKDNNANNLYNRIVKLRKEYGYNPSDEIIVDICINEIMDGKYKKFDAKSIMCDYTDEFLRKMRITGLISLRGAGRFVDINNNECEKVNYILQKYANYSHYSCEIDYFNYIAELDTNLINIHTQNIATKQAEELLYNWLDVYSWESIKKELENLSSGKASQDSILRLLSAPPRLEFLTALAIKSQFHNIRVIPNYCCDDTGLPTSTAGGNKGDIECYEFKYGILIEVTMATGRTQTMMEIWPIERHLVEIQRTIESQCIFIAPTIFPDSKRQIDFVSYSTNGNVIIRPYTILDFISFLENTKSLYHQHEQRYTIAAEDAAKYNTTSPQD